MKTLTWAAIILENYYSHHTGKIIHIMVQTWKCRTRGQCCGLAGEALPVTLASQVDTSWATCRIQLPATWQGKTMKDDPRTLALVTYIGDMEKPLLLASAWSSTDHCSHLGSDTTNGRSLSLSFSLPLPLSSCVYVLLCISKKCLNK